MPADRGHDDGVQNDGQNDGTDIVPFVRSAGTFNIIVSEPTLIPFELKK